MAIPFTLTKGERAMIADRLSLPDCMVEAFLDLPEGEPPRFTESEIRDAIVIVAAAVERGVIFPDSLDDVRRAVLIEAIEGSTWAAGYLNGDRAKVGALRVMRSAANKFIDAGIAQAIDVPHH